MTARISIVDINDDTPHFRESTLDLVFSESAPVNTFRIMPQVVIFAINKGRDYLGLKSTVNISNIYI